MTAIGHDSLNTRRTLSVEGKDYEYFSLAEAAKSLGDVSRLPVSLKVLLENILRFENGQSYKPDDARAIADWLKQASSTKEVPFRPARILMQDFTGVPGVVDLAAMRDGITRLGGKPEKRQPAGAGRSGDRPFGDGGCVRHPRRAAKERRDRVRAQRRALPVPALGPGGVRQFPRRAARHRHLPSGEPGISRAGGVDLAERRQDLRLSRHAVRHRQPHHDGQRARRARLGRRRHRGGGGDARPADRHADPRRDRFPPDRPAARGRDGDRPRADRHADAAAQGRRRKVRGILRRRPRHAAARRPRDDRQHGAGIRRHLRLLPGRQDHARLHADVGPRRAPHRAGGGVLPRAGHVARHEHARSGVHRHAGARPLDGAAEPRRPEAAAGQGAAEGRLHRVPRGADQEPRRARQRRRHQGKSRRQELRDHPRRRGDRRHHLLHQHVEPVGAGRRRAWSRARRGPRG